MTVIDEISFFECHVCFGAGFPFVQIGISEVMVREYLGTLHWNIVVCPHSLYSRYGGGGGMGSIGVHISQ